ncbi:MAG: sulfatase-like hydrolase/transferase [Alphaproteobacteria bacterium]
MHIFDLLTVWEYSRAGNFALLQAYADMILIWAAAAIAGIILFFLLRYFDTRVRPFSVWHRSRTVAYIVLLGAVINTVIFANGNFFWAASNQFLYSRMKQYGPLIVSYLLSSGADYVRVNSEMNVASALGHLRNADRPPGGGAACVDCPDIITVHVESVFDPKILAAYANAPSLTDMLNPRLPSINGPLKTHVAGGMSMISEFIFNCGINHQMFGTAGSYPNLFMPKLIDRCVPGYLRDNGYETELISSVRKDVMRYGEVYRAYGVDEIFEPGTLNVPTDWVKMRDHYFVDAAIGRLEQPRHVPRLVMLLTWWNHGPHGNTIYADRSELFSGPYDLKPAGDEALHDYINRLNDSIVAFRRLEDYIEKSPVPTVIIYYGDHHPTMQLTYSEEAREQFGEDIDHITFYRIVRNFGRDVPSVHHRYLGIDHLFSEGLKFAGIKLPHELQVRDSILQSCAQQDSGCTEEQRRALRALILK